MSIKRTFLPLALAVVVGGLLFSACGGGQKAHGNRYLKRIGVTPYELDTVIADANPENVINRNDDGSIYLGILIAAGGAEDSPQMRALNSLTSVSFVMIARDGSLIDSLYTDDIQLSGISTSTASVVGTAGVNWDLPRDAPKTFSLITIFRSDGNIWVQESSVKLPERTFDDPVVISLDIEEVEQGLNFTMRAKRVSAAGVSEYLPSSEMYRIEVYQGPISVWSSSYEMSFTQNITAVEPDKIGESVTYEEVWNGLDNQGQPVAPGVLTVVATIPAKPKPYVVRKEIDWSGL